MNQETETRLKNKKKKELKKWNIRMIYTFEVIAAVLFVLGLLIPLRPASSELEKRKLAEFPSMSLSGIWDGSFFNDVSTWYSDTYPFREAFLSMGSGIESLYGLHTQEIYGNTNHVADEIPDSPTQPAPVKTVTPKPEQEVTATPEPQTPGNQTSDTSATPAPETPEQNADENLPDGTIHATPEVAGTVYIADNKGFEIYYFNRGGADAYASMINTVRASLDSDVNVYDMLTPTNFSVCLDETIQSDLGGSSVRDAFNYINGMLDPSVIQIPVLDTLIDHNAEYIYYNTDHHWTALGAYYAYLEFCEAKGFTPHELSDFTEVQYPGFLGTFYSYSNQSEALANNPDTVYGYIPMGTNDETVTDADGSTYELNVVNDMSNSSAGSKYSAFLGGDQALTEIHNPNITDGSSILLVKESYGNAFAPFLVDHYQNVYIVDYRYYTGSLIDFIESKNIKDVLFLNNSDALSEANSETMLNLFY